MSVIHGRIQLYMKIMVSACLTGENCKYNGGNNRNEHLMELLAGHEIIPVCPEVMGGLPTPRVPAEIRNGIVTTKDGRAVDREFRDGAQRCLEIALQEQPDLIVLKSRSPSCGVKQRYDGSFSGILVSEPGVSAKLLMQHGFPVTDEEDFLSSAGERLSDRAQDRTGHKNRKQDGNQYTG